MADEKEDGLKLFSPVNNVDDTKTAEAATFIPESEGKNGISPISVEHMKAKFTGLTKEELMKFANDPFWVRLRWSLFILFWLIWLLMLFTAVFIIVVTPKCQETPPLKWWERSPLYVLDVKKLVSNDTPQGSIIEILKSRIDYLKQELGLESLLLKSVMESKDGYDEVVNFTNVNRNLQPLDSFHHEIIDYANSRGVQILLGFSPNYSGKWILFIRSEEREKNYRDFYVWHPNNASKADQLPNNWLSVYDTPAWEWDDMRKQFYLHQFKPTQPDLNYRNPAVVKFMSDVLEFWLNLGIRGFYLDKTEYLFEDESFKDEDPVGDGFNHKQYKFFSHTETFELAENVDLLETWSKVIRNSSGIICVSGGILHKNEIADFVLRPSTLRKNFSAVNINESVAAWNKSVSRPTWEWKCASLNENCLSDSDRECLTIVSFLLRGIPVVHIDDELEGLNIAIGTNKTEANSLSVTTNRIKLIQKLVKLRVLPSLSFGNYESFVISDSVFAFTRIKPGNPGYLVAWNLGYENVTINFQDHIEKVPKDLTVVISSGRSLNDLFEEKTSSNAVIMSSKSATVFSFVPLSK